jgi:hypothetical protein
MHVNAPFAERITLERMNTHMSVVAAELRSTSSPWWHMSPMVALNYVGKHSCKLRDTSNNAKEKTSVEQGVGQTTRALLNEA